MTDIQIRRVVSRLEPELFLDAFQAWAGACGGAKIEGEVVAIDGKAARGTAHAGRKMLTAVGG